MGSSNFIIHSQNEKHSWDLYSYLFSCYFSSKHLCGNIQHPRTMVRSHGSNRFMDSLVISTFINLVGDSRYQEPEDLVIADISIFRYTNYKGRLNQWKH